MSDVILRADRGRDLYGIWSSVVDDVTFYGTRAEIADELVRRAAEAARANVEKALTRAEETGTSGVDGGWDDATVWMCDGELPRAQLVTYLDLVAVGQDDAARALVQPLGC